MWEKVKLWWSKTGLSNIGWAAGFAASAIFQIWFAAGVCAGIFVYINFNVIKKLVDGLIKKEDVV